MQYEVHIHDATPDIASIWRLLQQSDPAALVDSDPATGMLRVSSSLSERELSAVLAKAGCPAGPRAIRRLPSQCCGGCGG